MKIALIQQHATRNKQDNLARGVNALEEASRHDAQLIMYAELVSIPQARAFAEWPAGMFEAELRIAAFQNGYFAALTNRVGKEDCLTFSGESFVVDPMGQVIARAPSGTDAILYAELDFTLNQKCPAKKHFLNDRRPQEYKGIGTGEL